MKHPHLMLYRLGNRLFRFGCPFVPSGITWLNRFLFSCYIPSSARLGKRVRFGYWGLGIVIHARSEIGDDCWIMQNVTIGRNLGRSGVPKLGRNVVVGAGAVIMGDVEIGDHCIIGANSVVRSSFPPRSVIAGCPAALIRTIPETEITLHYENR